MELSFTAGVTIGDALTCREGCTHRQRQAQNINTHIPTYVANGCSNAHTHAHNTYVYGMFNCGEIGKEHLKTTLHVSAKAFYVLHSLRYEHNYGKDKTREIHEYIMLSCWLGR